MPETVVHHDPVEKVEADPALMSRRRFLSFASGVLSAVIAAGLGLPLVRFYVGNVFKPKKERWLKLGSVSAVEVGQPHLFHSSYIDLDGWRQTTRRQAVYALTSDGKEFTVLSNACTHLGCPVHWDEQSKLFICPCHGAGFSLEGQVVKGPPPRPLDRLEHKIENGLLYVHIK